MSNSLTLCLALLAFAGGAVVGYKLGVKTTNNPLDYLNPLRWF